MAGQRRLLRHKTKEDLHEEAMYRVAFSSVRLIRSASPGAYRTAHDHAHIFHKIHDNIHLHPFVYKSSVMIFRIQVANHSIS